MAMRQIKAFVIVHRSGKWFLDRDGQPKEWPMFFDRVEPATQSHTKAQIPDDWDVVQVVIDIQLPQA